MQRSKLSKAKNWPTVLEYAESIRDGSKIACDELKQCVDRFFRDLENRDYELDPKAPEFCIGIIEKTLCHQQGERLDGTPLRGEPFLLEPWQKFIVYNLVGFKAAGANTVRFHEALIFVPRKQGKTAFAGALAWSLSLLYRKSGAKMYIASAALMQSLETFNFLSYNIRRMGEDAKDGGSTKIIDNNNEHSLTAELPDGSFFIRALAANPDILLMDEPFGAVDEITRKMLQSEIIRIHEQLGVTIVFITHDIKEALKLGTRVMVMNKGLVEQLDTPDHIRNTPATPFVKELIEG